MPTVLSASRAIEMNSSNVMIVNIPAWQENNGLLLLIQNHTLSCQFMEMCSLFKSSQTPNNIAVLVLNKLGNWLKITIMLNQQIRLY